jgi:hypothetical protein
MASHRLDEFSQPYANTLIQRVADFSLRNAGPIFSVLFASGVALWLYSIIKVSVSFTVCVKLHIYEKFTSDVDQSMYIERKIRSRLPIATDKLGMKILYTGDDPTIE